MKNYKFFNWFGGIIVTLLVLISCEDGLEGQTFLTSESLSISETLESDERFSMYVEILDKTGLLTSLHSYGSYTCLAPTNEAVTEYISKKWGVTSVSELTSEDQLEFLDVLVKFHTVTTSRSASTYIEGRMLDTTYTGDFLTTSFLDGGGISNLKINRSAGFVEFDISAINGTIHVLDEVLEPYVNTLPATMELAGTHNIFVEALKQTGLDKTFGALYDETGKRNIFTILAESDKLYEEEGILSFNDLANKYSPSDTDYTNADNGLNQFIAYHVTESFLYTADFPDDQIISTVLLNGAITSFKTEKELKINEKINSDGTWTSIIVDESNKPAKNGVYHSVDKILDIFVPGSKYVFYDVVSDQPEIDRLKSHVKVESTFWSNIEWFPETEVRYLRQSRNANWEHTVLDIANVAFMEFKTPVIPVGKYELLISSNGGNGSRAAFQVYWDDVPLGPVYNLTKKFSQDDYENPIAMAEAGWRRGHGWDGLYADSGGKTGEDLPNYARFIISNELICPVQKRHTVRLETLKSGNSPIDYIEWIPIFD